MSPCGERTPIRARRRVWTLAVEAPTWVIYAKIIPDPTNMATTPVPKQIPSDRSRGAARDRQDSARLVLGGHIADGRLRFRRSATRLDRGSPHK